MTTPVETSTAEVAASGASVTERDLAALSAPHLSPILGRYFNREGDTFIGNERVEPGDLKDRLVQLATEDPGRIVYVRGDRTISYARLMDTLGLVSIAGFAKVSLLAEGAQPK